MNKTELTEIDLNHYNSVKDKIIDDEDIKKIRYVEIYKITCKETNKTYIGQTVVHVLNHKRYRPYGTVRRFNAHVSEAGSDKYGQCSYLNDDIIKYGAENFTVEVLIVCDEKDGSFHEMETITKYNSLQPNGYNYLFCNNRSSNAKSFSKYEKIKALNKLDEEYLIKTSVQGIHIGWRVRINRIDTAFKSAKCSPDENKQKALDFIQELREYIKAKHLVAGSS